MTLVVGRDRKASKQTNGQTYEQTNERTHVLFTIE